MFFKHLELEKELLVNLESYHLRQRTMYGTRLLSASKSRIEQFTGLRQRCVSPSYDDLGIGEQRAYSYGKFQPDLPSQIALAIFVVRIQLLEANHRKRMPSTTLHATRHQGEDQPRLL
jgi:hypothetical protein